MTQWRAETERWRKAHDKLENELRCNRDFTDRVRAYIRKQGLERDLLEFLMATHLGEEGAAKFLADVRDDRVTDGQEQAKD